MSNKPASKRHWTLNKQKRNQIMNNLQYSRVKFNYLIANKHKCGFHLIVCVGSMHFLTIHGFFNNLLSFVKNFGHFDRKMSGRAWKSFGFLFKFFSFHLLKYLHIVFSKKKIRRISDGSRLFPKLTPTWSEINLISKSS